MIDGDGWEDAREKFCVQYEVDLTRKQRRGHDGAPVLRPSLLTTEHQRGEQKEQKKGTNHFHQSSEYSILY